MPTAIRSTGSYRFRLEFCDQAGQRVQDVALDRSDFLRAELATYFDAMKRGLAARYDPPLETGRVEPRFADPAGGSPITVGFCMGIPTPDGGELRHEFDRRFFRSRANHIALELKRTRQVAEDSTLLYQLTAYMDGEENTSEAKPRIQLETATVEVPIRVGRRTEWSRAEPWDDPRPEDMPVLIPRRVLEEAVDEGRRLPDREVGGVLLGHLRRDPEALEVFLEVTCLVPAEQTTATSTSVTFTPATWARVREVAELRGDDEVFVGWFHTHPFTFCKLCPLPTPPECIAKILFYSIDDEFLMEQSFPQPFMVGLLAAVEPKLDKAIGHLPVRLYGWRDGVIQQRGFEVIDS